MKGCICMKVHQTDFSKGTVSRNIISVAIPMTAAQVLNLLYNIVDRIYIGMIPGTGQTALGGLGLCFPIIMLIPLSPIYSVARLPFAESHLAKRTKKKHPLSWETPSLSFSYPAHS